ncbi:MAG: hypothetical protein MJK14_09355 [Rivularia sp. ALOHA_DT_140]|nr:hypothetical protein [Rivularia sp. ALOHA_DT_140]
MKKQILSLTIAIPTVLLIGFPELTNTVKKVALRKIHRVKYQATKLDRSMDAMLNPEKGGIRPMPPPPVWIPPVEEGVNNQLPPAYIPRKPRYRDYTPMRHLPPSTPWIVPTTENEGQLRDTPRYQIR